MQIMCRIWWKMQSSERGSLVVPYEQLVTAGSVTIGSSSPKFMSSPEVQVCFCGGDRMDGDWEDGPLVSLSIC
jgi:hypothetical protein